MTRSASVYQRLGAWIVGPYARMTSGLWVATDPFLSLPTSVGYPRLAREALAAISRSRTIPYVNLRDTPLPLPDPILEAAGVKSWATFHKGAQLVSLTSDDDQIAVSPNINKGAREGFIPLPDDIVVSATVTVDALGEAIEQAFAACR